ncbi:MAG: M48 family metalloprotease [Myxococcales bacterium]|nr:M48 family metalloprotease [Myxococcales bacterium]
MRRLSLVVALAAALGCGDATDDWVPVPIGGRPSAATRTGSAPAAPATPGTSAPTTTPRPTTPASPPPASSPAATPAGPFDPAVAADAPRLERGDTAYLRGRVRAVHDALLAALPERERAELRRVSLVLDDAPGEVNAFAACLHDGRALVALTDGILQVQSQLARARAADEVFGTGRLDAYLAGARTGRRLVEPASFIPDEQERDPRKRARQATLLDEGLAFVVGHELAHHRLAHTGCVGGAAGAVTLADVARELSAEVPGFNQPNELAADVYGVQHVLAAGARGGAWTEGGALLLCRFFQARSDLSIGDELRFAFERTHPPAALRIPVIEEAALGWRAAGGRSLPVPPPLVLPR